MLKNTTTGTSKSLGHIHGIQNIDFQETEVQLYILVYKILYWPTEVFIPALSKIKILGLTVTLNSARLQCLVCEKIICMVEFNIISCLKTTLIFQFLLNNENKPIHCISL